MSGKIDVVVKRRTWARGSRLPTNRLLGSDGMRCCLGFVMQAEGYTDDELLGHSLPARSALECGRLTGLCVQWGDQESLVVDTALADQAMGVNDSASLSDAERERRLLKLFKDSPYNLRFED